MQSSQGAAPSDLDVSSCLPSGSTLSVIRAQVEAAPDIDAVTSGSEEPSGLMKTDRVISESEETSVSMKTNRVTSGSEETSVSLKTDCLNDEIIKGTGNCQQAEKKDRVTSQPMDSLSCDEHNENDNSAHPDNSDENNSNLSDFSDLSQESWQPVQGPIAWVQEQMRRGQSPRRILQNLVPSGTKIPEGLDAITLWKIIINIVSEPPRRKKLRDINTLDDVLRLLHSSKKIIVLTGAGVSVSSGIPDFRSKDGVYARLAKDFPNLPDPQAMFDIQFFRSDARPFFKFAKEIYPGQFKPSPCHRFIRMLEEKGKLLRNYTQNIDTLEQVAGIERVVQCHGSFATATCTQCGHRVDSEVVREDIFNQVIPHCPRCSPSNQSAIMKPDIVFFGESLPQLFHNQMAADKDQCDLLVVIGSSLKVRPVALIPNSLPVKVPQVLINRERLNCFNFDVELLGNCDDIIGELCRRLGPGWEELATSGPPLHEVFISNLPTPPASPVPSFVAETAPECGISAVTSSSSALHDSERLHLTTSSHYSAPSDSPPAAAQPIADSVQEVSTSQSPRHHKGQHRKYHHKHYHDSHHSFSVKHSLKRPFSCISGETCQSGADGQENSSQSVPPTSGIRFKTREVESAVSTHKGKFIHPETPANTLYECSKTNISCSKISTQRRQQPLLSGSEPAECSSHCSLSTDMPNVASGTVGSDLTLALGETTQRTCLSTASKVTNMDQETRSPDQEKTATCGHSDLNSPSGQEKTATCGHSDLNSLSGQEKTATCSHSDLNSRSGQEKTTTCGHSDLNSPSGQEKTATCGHSDLNSLFGQEKTANYGHSDLNSSAFEPTAGSECEVSSKRQRLVLDSEICDGHEGVAECHEVCDSKGVAIEPEVCDSHEVSTQQVQVCDDNKVTTQQEVCDGKVVVAQQQVICDSNEVVVKQQQVCDGNEMQQDDDWSLESVCDSEEDSPVAAVRQMWQERCRVSLASRLEDNQVLFWPPSRYIFKGAEVYSESEDSSEDEEESDEEAESDGDSDDRMSCADEEGGQDDVEMAMSSSNVEAGVQITSGVALDSTTSPLDETPNATEASSSGTREGMEDSQQTSNVSGQLTTSDQGDCEPTQSDPLMAVPCSSKNVKETLLPCPVSSTEGFDLKESDQINPGLQGQRD